jgi:O-antigen/teichoic acid export membrane protein
VDTLIVGKLAGAGPLGLYTVGLELADLPTTELAAPVSRAVFPGYARLAGDRERLAASYLETFSAMLLVSMPASVGIGLAAEPLIRVWLGPAWLDTVPLIQALIVFGLCRTAYGNAGAVYMALGRLRIEPAMMLAYIVVLVPLLYLLIPPYGVMGAAYALTTTAAANLVLNKLALTRLLGFPPRALLARTWRTMAATAGMVMVVRLLPCPLASDLGRLFWTASLGGSAFLGGLTLLCRLADWPPGPEQRLFDYVATTLRRRPTLAGQGGR